VGFAGGGNVLMIRDVLVEALTASRDGGQ